MMTNPNAARPSRLARFTITLGLALALAADVGAQTQAPTTAAASGSSSSPSPAPWPAPAPRVVPCDSARYHEFDFWVGRWEVRTPDGKLAGHNQIERMPSGCALEERWTGAGGGHGTSLNFYDRATRQWHQVWVDGGGGVLRLTGGREGASMVLAGTAPGANGQQQRQRITWTPLPGGRVRQHWETSSDGTRWQTVFDGEYRPVAP